MELRKELVLLKEYVNGAYMASCEENASCALEVIAERLNAILNNNELAFQVLETEKRKKIGEELSYG